MGWFGVQKFFASDDKAPVVSKTIPKADYSFKPTGDKLLDDCIKTVMPAYNYSGGSASYSQTKRACERSIRTGGRY